ncbi:hypothetical protein EVAR_3937_1 [Eumeta japonica]|uniref:Uncharacterized protein n=1 Tax=Eumeta variegata TaxID=151549 RepID=A0A4C1SR30_EUMVA|nr:hypothetical protein EVAR_3937_1 [Eumeta japonica]
MRSHLTYAAPSWPMFEEAAAQNSSIAKLDNSLLVTGICSGTLLTSEEVEEVSSSGQIMAECYSLVGRDRFLLLEAYGGLFLAASRHQCVLTQRKRGPPF